MLSPSAASAASAGEEARRQAGADPVSAGTASSSFAGEGVEGDPDSPDGSTSTGRLSSKSRSSRNSGLAAAALASVRMVMGSSSHLLPDLDPQRKELSPEEVQRQLELAAVQAQASLEEWAQKKEYEELMRLKARSDALAEDAEDVGSFDHGTLLSALGIDPSEVANQVKAETVQAVSPPKTPEPAAAVEVSDAAEPDPAVAEAQAADAAAAEATAKAEKAEGAAGSFAIESHSSGRMACLFRGARPAPDQATRQSHQALALDTIPR